MVAKIMSLEENGEDIVDDNFDIEKSLLETDIDNQQTSDILDKVENGQIVEQALINIDNTENKEDALKIATEALLKIVGVKQGSISTEDFSYKLDKNVTLAQEGLFKRIGNAAIRLFKTDNKIKKDLNKYLNILKETGPREGIISEPGWARGFNINKAHITPDDVINKVKAINSLVQSADVMGTMNEVFSIYKEAINDYNKGNLLTTDEVVIAKLTKKIDDLDKIHQKIKQSLGDDTNPKRVDADYEPLDYQKAKQLDEHVQKFMDIFDKVYETSMEIFKYQNAFDPIYSHTASDGRVNAVANLAADLIKRQRITMKQLNDKLFKIMMYIEHFWSVNDKMAYTASRYIKASAK